MDVIDKERYDNIFQNLGHNEKHKPEHILKEITINKHKMKNSMTTYKYLTKIERHSFSNIQWINPKSISKNYTLSLIIEH